MRVGIVAGSMKPTTRGHWALIRRAAAENDRVILFVSTTDRGGVADEAVIRGTDMVEVWERFLLPHLPANVELRLGGSPIRRVYETLGEANIGGSQDVFTVYSDPDDIRTRFGPEKQTRYFGGLVQHGQVCFVGVQRVGDADVSATQMRQLLKQGQRDAFIALLPEGIDGRGIWELLILRSVVRDA